MKITVILSLITNLFGCSPKNHKLDGPDMEYNDRDYRTEYANVLDFDGAEGKPLFAVAFSGCGKDAEKQQEIFVNELFCELSDSSKEKITHFDFGGDEWYLVVPRYREYVDITNTETGEKHTVYHGEAFTINCRSNAQISTDSHGGHKYTLCTDDEGKLISNGDVWDITDYQTAKKDTVKEHSEVMVADYFCSNTEGGHYELVLMCGTDESGERYTRLDVYIKHDSGSEETRTSYQADYTAVKECREVAGRYGFDLWDTRHDTISDDGVKLVCKYLSESGETVRVSNEKMPENGREEIEEIRIILEGFIKEENRIG